MKFYFGAASGSERKAIQKLEPENVMISYSTMHCSPIKSVENHFYDSGAYSLFSPRTREQPHTEYPWTCKEYIDFMEWAEPEKFALMDYVCEPEVRNYHGWTVQRQQQKSVTKYRELLEQYDKADIDAEPVAVVQGWEKQDYLEHIDQLRDNGLLTETIGIGTLCGRKDTTEIRDIVNAVREALHSKHSLHGFGVKSDGFQYPSVRRNLDSADSLASSMAARYNRHNSDIPMWWRQTQQYIQFYDNLRSYFQTGSEPRDPAQKQLEVVRE